MKLTSVVAIALLTLLSACANRSHIRGCELQHPYHEAKTPSMFVMPDGLKAPRTRATFHVPAQEHLADQPDNLVTAEDVKTLDKAELASKRCIVAPPRMPAVEAAPIEEPAAEPSA